MNTTQLKKDFLYLKKKYSTIIKNIELFKPFPSVKDEKGNIGIGCAKPSLTIELHPGTPIHLQQYALTKLIEFLTLNGAEDYRHADRLLMRESEEVITFSFILDKLTKEQKRYIIMNNSLPVIEGYTKDVPHSGNLIDFKKYCSSLYPNN